MMKKIIVTAANSFIGRRLCKAYCSRGDMVYAVVRNSFDEMGLFYGIKNIKLIYCNMEEYSSLAEIIDDVCDVGIALAWDGTRGEKRSDGQRQKQNLSYSMDSIHSFHKLGCRIVVTAGSQAEYGLQRREEKIKETDVCCPKTEYGKYKLFFYEQANKYCRQNKIRLIEPRFFSLYGEDDSEETMLVSMARNMILNKPCNLTKAIQLWDFLHVDDAVQALMLLIEKENTEGVYNFGTGRARELRKYIEEMKYVMGSQSELRYGILPYPEGIVHVNPSVEKLKSAINWKPNISFQKAI